ncbi:MAG: AAA family ATPase [Chloroflexi bacterium]|nr:AAA family ATPase [Chloroflexota bacterium]
MTIRITDDIDALIDVFPPHIGAALREAGHFDSLLEVVLDLGRVCEARYVEHELALTSEDVTQEEIDHVVARIGDFGEDNRAGIARTLHRISAIRNRRGHIVGLTCRVGRAVYGTIEVIEDIVRSGKSLLLLGRPGVGKTTMLREVARVLAEKRRVIVVDTSNEIGGDGDIPHPAVGRARRMQVITPSLQHAVMIEAVENHMPEVIVIDEIGTELEASAARTIAERGVQLVGTAHGNTLDNLMMNPTLSDLVGGIQSVTLGDDEARRRGTQKSVLERKAPPTFDVVIEIQDRDRVAVREDVAASVDALLRGRNLPAEIRVRTESGEIEKMQEVPLRIQSAGEDASEPLDDGYASAPVTSGNGRRKAVRMYPYGLNHNRLRQVSRRLGVSLVMVPDLEHADALVTVRTYYRKRPAAIEEAERRGIPVYVLRSNTETQMERFLAEVFELDLPRDTGTPLMEVALQDARRAIDQVISGERTSVQLSSQDAMLRKMQHQMAKEANLFSRSSGAEPQRRVTIYANR